MFSVMAEKLYRSHTRYTPEIKFDPDAQEFHISGISRPEDAYEFYEPLLSLVEDYVKNMLEASNKNKLDNQTFTILFDFKYMNSSSSKYIFQIISNFKKLYDNQLHVKIFWYYDDSDDQILEDGEDLSDIINLPFIFVSRE
jgi:hypothetical protein